MGLVIGDLFIVILAIAVLGAIIYKISTANDSKAVKFQQQLQAEEQRMLEREAKIYEKDIPLICIGCETKFKGPMPETGCPHCHSLTLVITEEEFLSK
jgi:Zn finger protein HypA/HybF involved in hydrogenase expression